MCKDNLADPLWVLAEEELECVQFLWDTLDVVQSVDTNNDLDAVEAVLELLDTFLDVGLLQVLLKDVRFILIRIWRNGAPR